MQNYSVGQIKPQIQAPIVQPQVQAGTYVAPAPQIQAPVVQTQGQQTSVYSYPQGSVYPQSTATTAPQPQATYPAPIFGSPQPQTLQIPNYSGVNIQIINPTVNAPGTQTISQPSTNTYSQVPSNVGTSNDGQVTSKMIKQETDSTDTKKKMEKRQIVELTDDYIKTLENYLNSQDSEIRLMGAKDLIARLEEDPSRKDDVALNVLVNKMLQDPSSAVRFLAMAALEARTATGNLETVQLLKNIQQQNTSYGQDSLKASNILLKMAGNTIEKEFEVKDNPASKTVKTTTQTTEKTGG